MAADDKEDLRNGFAEFVRSDLLRWQTHPSHMLVDVTIATQTV